MINSMALEAHIRRAKEIAEYLLSDMLPYPYCKDKININLTSADIKGEFCNVGFMIALGESLFTFLEKIRNKINSKPILKLDTVFYRVDKFTEVAIVEQDIRLQFTLSLP